MSVQCTAFPLADANGNAVTYLDNAGNVQAHYVYDAFGGTVSLDGDMADYFSFRFSSKYLDDETGLYYYGYRYFSPELGRWINRDPIGEQGGINLFSTRNIFVNDIDPFGLTDSEGEWSSPFSYVNGGFKFDNSGMYLGLWFDSCGNLGVSYKYLYYRMVMNVEYGTCCKLGTEFKKEKVYKYSSDITFFDDATKEYMGGE